MDRVGCHGYCCDLGFDLVTTLSTEPTRGRAANVASGLSRAQRYAMTFDRSGGNIDWCSSDLDHFVGGGAVIGI